MLLTNPVLCACHLRDLASHPVSSPHTPDDNLMICFQGWLSPTELYYGYYTNKTINIDSDKSYKMQVAYLFTCGGYYLLTLLILGQR